MKPHLLIAFVALSLLELPACSRSQSSLPSAAFSSESQSLLPSADSTQSCNNFEPPIRSLHGVYNIPAHAAGPSAECALDEALASGKEVVGYDDIPFLWQSLDALTAPIPMPLAVASSSPKEPAAFRYSKVVPPGAPRAWVSSGTLPLSVVAAYRETNGVVDTFQGDADSTSVLNQMLDQWNRAGPGPHASAAERQNTLQPFKFDPKVWTNFGNFDTSVSINGPGRVSGKGSAGFRVFRLNTKDPKYDYFLITLDGLNQVQGWNDCKYDFPRFYCEWLNRGLRLTVYLARINSPQTPIGTIFEAEPKSAITSGKYEISEGAELKTEVNCAVGDQAGMANLVQIYPVAEHLRPQEVKCGVNAGATYSSSVTQSWDVQSRNVHNYTAPLGTTGDWDMTFSGWNDQTCKGGPFPEDLKTAGDFGAAEIIKVDRNLIYGAGQPRLQLAATLRGRTIGWEYLLNCSGSEYQSGWAIFPTFELPTFYVNTTQLTVRAGGSSQFVVSSKIPDAEIGLGASLWLIKNGTFIKDPSKVGLTVTADNKTAYAIAAKRPDIMPRVQTWTISAATSAEKGTYTLYVDTVPGGATDNVRSGPLEVSLTIN